MQVTVACVQQASKSREEERKKKEANSGVIPTAMQDGMACFKQPRRRESVGHTLTSPNPPRGFVVGRGGGEGGSATQNLVEDIRRAVYEAVGGA